MFDNDTYEKNKMTLLKMNNSSLSLDQFYDLIESEITANLNENLLSLSIEKHYNSIIDLDQRKSLVKYLINGIQEITLYKLFKIISKIIDMEIRSPLFIMHKLIRILQKQLKFSEAGQFVDSLKLGSSKVIDKKVFCEKIMPILKFDEISTSILFQLFDYKRLGSINLEELTVILDSYFDQKKKDNDLKSKSLFKFKELLYNNSITLDNIFEKINSNPPKNEYAYVKDFLRFIIKELGLDKLSVKEILHSIQVDNDKIYKNSFVKAFEVINIGSTDNPYSEVHIHLNDVEVFWLNKLNLVMTEMNLSSQNLIDSHESDTKINLDVMSKKLRSIIPEKRLSSLEIENIITCIDINKNKEISLKEFNDLLQLSNSDKTLRKTLRQSINKLEPLKKSSLSKEFKTQKTYNIKDLPIKGNIEVINDIRQSIMRSKTEDINFKEQLKLTKIPSKEDSKVFISNSKEFENKVIEPSPKNKENNIDDFHRVHTLKQSSKKMEVIMKKKTTIQIDSEDKKYFGLKEEQIDAKKIVVDENLIREVLKELDLLDEGQDLLIDLLENNVTFDEAGKNPVFNVFNMLLKNFPLIERGKLFEISKCIDDNRDGFIEINDLIEFLLNQMNYKSFKLAYKTILKRTKNDISSLEEKFLKEKLNLDSMISLVEFLKFFKKNFDLDPAIIKKLYDEIKEKKAKTTLQIVDIIDSLNEFEVSENNQNLGNKISNSNKMNILEMKSFEIEIKKFVKSYIQTYGKPFEGNDFNLPKKINIEKFREFIKEAKINFQLGMSIFYLIKSFSNNRNEYFIMKDDLFEFLNSYKGEIEPLSISDIVQNLENYGCPLKFCFANLPTANNGASKIDLESALQKCYPNFSNEVLNKIVTELNRGMSESISLTTIQEFLMKYTKYGFLPLLEFKKIAAILDKEEKDTLEFLSSKGIKENKSVNENQHQTIFADLMSKEASIELNKYLCEKSKSSGQYNLNKLIEQIEFYRDSPKSYNEIADIITKMNKFTNNFSNYFKELNNNKPFGRAFDSLNLSHSLEISITELIRRLSNFYGNFDKKQLLVLIKIIDVERTGFIKYEDFYQRITKNLIEYEHSVVFHLKYISKKIQIEFKGDYLLYLKSKNLNMESYMKEGEFYEKFKDDFFKDLSMIKKLADCIKETEGNNLGIIFSQNLIDTLINCEDVYNSTDHEFLIDYKYSDIIKMMNNIESVLPIKLMYEYIEPNSVSNHGKISFYKVIDILNTKFSLNEEEKKSFLAYFSCFNILFDLFKLTSFLQVNSSSSMTELEIIIFKIKNSISQSNTLISNSFFKKYNLDQFKPFNISELLLIIPSIFKISKYETIIIFQYINNDPLNLNRNMKINLDLIFQILGIYEVFVTNPKKVKLDNYIMHSLKILYELIQGNQENFFRKYDKDNDSVLSREEFMLLLKECDSQLKLNDSQRISIIKLADINNDSTINYPEFLHFLNILKSEYPQADDQIKSPTKKMATTVNFASPRENNKFITSTEKHTNFNTTEKKPENLVNDKLLSSNEKTKLKQIEKNKIVALNMTKLNESFIYNNSNKNVFETDTLYSTLFKLQIEINADSNKYYKMIEDLHQNSLNDSIIPIDILVKNLEKYNIIDSEENKERLLEFSLEDLPINIKPILRNTKCIDYNGFFNNIVNMKLGKKEMLLIKKNEKLRKNAKLVETKKNRIDNQSIKIETVKCSTVKGSPIKGSPIKELEIYNERIPILKIDDNSFDESKQAELKIIINNDYNDENENDNLEEMFSNIDQKVKEKLKNLKIDLNKSTDLEKLRIKLSSVFEFSNQSKYEKVKWSKNEKINFLKFIITLINLEYKGYNYEINPDNDYFKRNGKMIPTILNNEDAAIKKCEEIFDSIEIGGEFSDKDFGPQLNDNGVGNKFSLYLNGAPMKGHMEPNMIDWYRMTEISPEESPKFIDDGVESNDVMQGAIGDCWFISALSVLATKDYLLRGEFNPNILNDGEIDAQENIMLSSGIYPPIFHKFRSKNIFCFKFYKNFRIRYVIIDDKLPCKKVYSCGQTPKLLYGKCRNDNEFWVPLIEKAYAKLHGCYEALVSGFIDDGLVDLTGFVSKKVFVNTEFKTKEDYDKLWEYLLKLTKRNFDEKELGKYKDSLKASLFLRNNTMIGCSVDSKIIESEVVYHNHKSGIIAGHAYALLDAFYIKKEGKSRDSRILRIRNPWGFKEWNGKWCDESEEIDKNKEFLQNLLGERYKNSSEKIILNSEDGTFMMCFSDFRQIFNKIYLCLDFPPTFISIRFYDKWTINESGGIPILNKPNEALEFAKNPQYYISFSKTTNCYISLQQNDGRLTKEKFPYVNCTRKNCIIIFKANSKQRLEKYEGNRIYKVSSIKQHRENGLTHEFEKGEYIVVPAIYKSGETGDFVLDFYFEDEFLDNYNEKNFISKLKSTVIEKLGNKNKNFSAELIDNDLMNHVRMRKNQFFYKQFKDILSGIWSKNEEYKKHTEEINPEDNY